MTELVLSIDQPYASLIMLGVKRFETRPMPLNGDMRPDGVRALVSCLDCGRPLTMERSHVASNGAEGTLWASCQVGHRNRMTVTLEVA